MKVVGVQLPLYVVAAQGQAWLQSAQCAASKAASTQTIGVQTGVANICIGTPLASGVRAKDVSGFSCAGTNARWNVASVSLLGTTIATVSAPSVAVPVVNPSSAVLMFDGNGNPVNGNSINSNAIGAVLDNSLQSTVTTLGQLTESRNGRAQPAADGARCERLAPQGHGPIPGNQPQGVVGKDPQMPNFRRRARNRRK
ncbi:hypothetical protein PSAC2689_70159 [Paraburkholderia sacchari]